MPVVRTQTVVGARSLRAFVDVTAGLVRGDVPDPDAAGEALAAARRNISELEAAVAERDRAIAALRAVAPADDAPDSRETIAGDPRDHFIAQVVQHRTFADVGGLYGTVSEKVSVARSHGATELSMIDIVPEGDELWRAFRGRLDAFGIADCQTISGNIIEVAERPDRPRFDVVHCTGVLYHLPDPLRLVAALHAMTAQYLILGSAITASEVRTDAGTLRLPSAGAIFVPGLRAEERSILESYWRPSVGDNALGLTSPVGEWNVADFAPWWWLPTIPCFIAMCEAAGFGFVDGATYWNRNAYVALFRRQ